MTQIRFHSYLNKKLSSGQQGVASCFVLTLMHTKGSNMSHLIDLIALGVDAIFAL